MAIPRRALRELTVRQGVSSPTASSSSSRLARGMASSAAQPKLPPVPEDNSSKRRGNTTPPPLKYTPGPKFAAARFNTGKKKPTTEKDLGKGKHRFNFNTTLSSFVEEPDPDQQSYRMVTAQDLAYHREPPTRVKMLVRDFIDDSLYNPHYGYFSKHVTIFTPPTDDGYNFKSFRNLNEFQNSVAERYLSEYSDAPPTMPSAGSSKSKTDSVIQRQVWHTPTELFKPYFARSLTTAILNQYKLNHFPHEDLIIYEVGGGNGSFMIDAMKFLRDEHPEVFAKTQYRIVEISGALAKIQRRRAQEAGLTNVEVIHEDFFKWEGGSPQPCFVVALEVFDNLSHDMVRYDLQTLEPRQAVVSIDKHGEFDLLYEPVTDPLLRRVMAYRQLLPPSAGTQPPLARPLLASATLRSAYASVPFAPNLTPADFVPTKATAFLERLRDQLPAHRLLVADFSELPDAVPGRNGPVVQTRYGNTMVPCSTFLVKQGYFDIFFPTDFELLKETYSLIMNSPSRREAEAEAGSETVPKRKTDKKGGKIGGDFFTGVKGFRRRQIVVYPQSTFLQQFGGEKEIAPTRTKDGASPMLGMYANAKVMF